MLCAVKMQSHPVISWENVAFLLLLILCGWEHLEKQKTEQAEDEDKLLLLRQHWSKQVFFFLNKL